MNSILNSIPSEKISFSDSQYSPELPPLLPTSFCSWPRGFRAPTLYMSASAISSADGLRALARSVRDAQLGIGQHDDAALSELLVQCEALLLAAKSAKSSL